MSDDLYNVSRLPAALHRRVCADPLLGAHFARVDYAVYTKMMYHILDAVYGETPLDAHAVIQVHRHLRITEAECDAWLGCLMAASAEIGISADDPRSSGAARAVTRTATLARLLVTAPDCALVLAGSCTLQSAAEHACAILQRQEAGLHITAADVVALCQEVRSLQLVAEGKAVLGGGR